LLAAAHVQGDALGDPSIGLDFNDLSATACVNNNAAATDVVMAASWSGDEDDADDDEDGAACSHDEEAGDGPSGEVRQPWDVSDADLEGVNILDLPSGSCSSSDVDRGLESEERGNDGLPLSKRRLSLPAGVARGRETGEEENTSDIDEDALMTAMFADDNCDETYTERNHKRDGRSSSSGDNQEPAVHGSVKWSGHTVHGSLRGKRRNVGAESVFAAYEDYEEVIGEVERQRGGAALASVGADSPQYMHVSCDSPVTYTRQFLTKEWVRCSSGEAKHAFLAPCEPQASQEQPCWQASQAQNCDREFCVESQSLQK
jgi:hypothetical protein